jgi:tetratricopeptide (TPR) repeat protein
MTHRVLISLTILVSASAVDAQLGQPNQRSVETPAADSRIVIGAGNELLSAGAEAIRYGRYDDGIRLTLLGLERPGNSDRIRAAALSNLCAAHAAKEEPDQAIDYCGQSIDIDEHNWRAYSNRAYAYWLKGMYPEAEVDLEAAVSINANARQILQLRGMLNEAGLRPRVIMEDHQ